MAATTAHHPVSQQHHQQQQHPKGNVQVMNKLKGMFGGGKPSLAVDTALADHSEGYFATSSSSDESDSSSGHVPSSALSPSASTTSLKHPATPVAIQTPQAIARSNSKKSNASVSSATSAKPGASALCPRIHYNEQTGKHEHVLKSNSRRQEKLRKMLGELMGNGKKVRDDAVSAMPDFLANSNSAAGPDLSLISGFVENIESGKVDPSTWIGNSSQTTFTPSGASTPLARTASSASLLEKYGKCQGIIGKGAYGIVRITQKFDQKSRCEKLFAIKEFKRRPEEDQKNFAKRLTSEFCISSSLHHVNIIQTLDLMKDFKGECCQVMEYCEGGDLYSLIMASEVGLTTVEADCFFKQICRGVVYMHSMGVAHCDLKPENILLTKSGCVKITDFGNGECFRMAWEKEIHLSSGVCGSRPYIAPEQFRDAEFDPRAVDVWAIGVIYMAMRTGSYLWQVAVPDEDKYYREYLQGRKHQNGYKPIEQLPRSRCRNVVYSILDPYPNRRITGKQILNSEWGRSIEVCDAGEKH